MYAPALATIYYLAELRTTRVRMRTKVAIALVLLLSLSACKRAPFAVEKTTTEFLLTPQACGEGWNEDGSRPSPIRGWRWCYRVRPLVPPAGSHALPPPEASSTSDRT